MCIEHVAQSRHIIWTVCCDATVAAAAAVATVVVVFIALLTLLYVHKYMIA